jgi:RHS repeat-associated protein
VLQATPTGAIAALTQDWTERYAFNGVGNLQSVAIERNKSSGSTREPFAATSTYNPVSPAAGQVLDRNESISTAITTGTPTQANASAAATGLNERLFYAPGGELLYRQVDDTFVFYVGEYATVTAKATVAGCSTSCTDQPCSCTPDPASVEVDNHVVFAGTRIASVKPARTLYYYRTRLGSVIATSLGGGVMGAQYRYDPYGKIEATVGETELTRSELGYANALRLTGGLLHLKNRVYDVEARLFVQADVVDRLRYAYVAGDPVNYSDPSGLVRMASSTSVLIYFDQRKAEGDALREQANNANSNQREQTGKPGAGSTEAERPAQKMPAAALAEEARRASGDDTSPWRLGTEWLSGTGQRTHVFRDGDRMTEMLRKHEHIRELADAVSDGRKPPAGHDNYRLSGLAGIPKYFKDYSTLLTFGNTGNLAVTYLGSYELDYTSSKCILNVHVYNRSSLESALHPPVLGYTDAWVRHVEPVLRSARDAVLGPSGMMSNTEQHFFFHMPLHSPDCVF